MITIYRAPHQAPICTLLSDTLRGAGLYQFNLDDAFLEKSDLRGADLYGASLQRARLQNANLSGADLRCANLRRARLRNADLSGADLTGANLEFASLIGANFHAANLSWTNLSGASLERADLRHADLSWSTLERSRFRRAKLRNACFNHTNLSEISDGWPNRLKYVKKDFWNHLAYIRGEVPKFLELLRAGRLGDSPEKNDPISLVETFTKFIGIVSLKDDPTRPAAVWFESIREGDTPQTSQFAKVTEEWTLQFLQRDWQLLYGSPTRKAATR